MISKKEIIDVLLDFGVSPIEADRITDSVDNFKSTIQSLWEDVSGHSNTEITKALKVVERLKEINWNDVLDAFTWKEHIEYFKTSCNREETYQKIKELQSILDGKEE